MSTVPPKAGRDSAMVRNEFLAEPHDVGRARFLRGLFSKAGGCRETRGKPEKQASTNY